MGQQKAGVSDRRRRAPKDEARRRGASAKPMNLTESRNPIKRRKLWEEVAARIESMVHEGRFSPGDRLPSERELMEELGVGRSAVREAMLSLQKMGILVGRSGGT